MPLAIWVERARGLPRPRLFRAPDPYAEVHYFPGAPPVGVSAPVRKEAAPEWPGFCARVAIAPGDAPPRTVGVVVRDAACRDAVLGRCFVRVAASVTEGWFPLDADAASPVDVSGESSAGSTDWVPPRDPAAYTLASAEVYMRIEWPEYCSLRQWHQGHEPRETVEPDGDPDGELRSASDEPGRFFRCGELLVAVRALGVPVATRDPQLALKTHDQYLRGYEAVPTGTSPSAAGGPSAPGDEERTFRPVLTKEEYSAAKKAGSRRDVNFGLFAFALFQGTLPDTLKLCVRDRGGRSIRAVAALVMNIADETVLLPQDIPGFSADGGKGASGRAVGGGGGGGGASDGGGDSVGQGEEPGDRFSYVMHFRATSAGAPADKVTFDVRVTYNLWQPTATCHNVTPRFRELLAERDVLAADFQRKFPHSNSITYLFVGGLFTQHYPKYFDYNTSYLKATLGLERVRSIPIHTEQSVASNAKVIRDSVVEAAGGRRSVVLVSHSKGGCDVCGAVARFPELSGLLYGIVSFQAPFSGTYLVGFVSQSKLAVGALMGAIRGLWGGERESFLDMGYASRLRDVLFGGDGGEGDAGGDAGRGGPQPSEANGGGGAVGASAASAAGRTAALERTRTAVRVLDDAHVADRLRLYGAVPTVCFASSAPYAVHKVRSVANAAGFASMAPAAQVFWANTGFYCDGLVAPCDARIPYADLVSLTDMMHTEPALYFVGTRYPPGELTAVGLALLFEKHAREGGQGGS
jgi:hypothetical protein